MHLTSLLAVAGSASFAAAAICSAGDAGDLSCLSGNAAATSYCSIILNAMNFLNPATTSTVTVTVGSTQTGEVTITSTEIDSVYITQGPTSTTYVTSVVSTTAEATVTTYTSPNATVSATAVKRDMSCDTSSALSVLSSLQVGPLSTVCSCIGAAPTATTMTTAGVVTVTVTAGSGPATTTTTITGEVNFTVQPSSTISTTVTSHFTETTTVSLAAPTFTQVFGPQSGCADSKPISIDYLPASVSQANATTICQGRCAQNSKCSFVMVQQMFPMYGTVEPFYSCSYNNRTFVESTDVICGQFVTIWGWGDGYNAIGRGVQN